MSTRTAAKACESIRGGGRGAYATGSVVGGPPSQAGASAQTCSYPDSCGGSWGCHRDCVVCRSQRAELDPRPLPVFLTYVCVVFSVVFLDSRGSVTCACEKKGELGNGHVCPGATPIIYTVSVVAIDVVVAVVCWLLMSLLPMLCVGC